MASSSSTRRSRCSSAASRSSTVIGIPLRVQQSLHRAMRTEHRLGPIGIVAHGPHLLVAADDVYGTAAQPFQSLAGHTGGLSDDDAGGVEIQADPLHRRGARHAQHQVQHVDAVLPEFQPEPFAENPGGTPSRRRKRCAEAAVRATSTKFRPAWASSRANSAPTPSEPPAISAHGPYFSVSITGLTRVRPLTSWCGRSARRPWL